MRTDTERLDWLAKQSGMNLVSDDGERWAVSGDGMQPVPEPGGFKETVSIASFVEPEQWHLDIRAAIDSAMDAPR